MEWKAFQNEMEKFSHKDCTIEDEAGIKKTIHPTKITFDNNLHYMYLCLFEDENEKLLLIMCFLESGYIVESLAKLRGSLFSQRDITIKFIQSGNDKYIFNTELHTLPPQGDWEYTTLKPADTVYRVASIESPWHEDWAYFTDKFTKDFYSSVKLAANSTVDKKIYIMKPKTDIPLIQINTWRHLVYGFEIGRMHDFLESNLMEACKNAHAAGWKAKVQGDNTKLKFEDATWEYCVFGAEELFDIVETKTLDEFVSTLKFRLRF